MSFGTTLPPGGLTAPQNASEITNDSATVGGVKVSDALDALKALLFSLSKTISATGGDIGITKIVTCSLGASNANQFFGCKSTLNYASAKNLTNELAGLTAFAANTNITANSTISRAVCSGGYITYGSSSGIVTEGIANYSYGVHLGGTVTYSLSYKSQPVFYGGTATNLYHFYAANAFIDSGFIGVQYGLFLENMTAGSTGNFAIYSQGGKSVHVGPIKVGSTNNPHVGALLDLESTTRLFVPPRMTTTQATTIPSKPTGGIYYDTTLGKLRFWNGTAYETITSSV